ncbi:MAG: branched-chain amino acid ABC transporter permease [Deltaproteobacteria bacterium]|nr:branched-chain amino acid ABC transporter permease [Deltaproteobacteria bacterium]
MSELLQTTINTLAVGGLYALIALGYTLVYGILRFINFAHSDIVAWGGWIGFTVAGTAGWLLTGAPPLFALPLVLLVTMVVCALMGVTIERLAYRPLRKAPRLNVLITAIGVSLFLQNVGLLDRFFGNRPVTMSSLLPNSVLATFGGVQLRLLDTLVIGLAVVLVVMLERIVYGTRMGRAMRAVSFDERTASLMGVNVNVVISVTFALGSALAAAGGILFALRNDLRMTADTSWVLLGLKAFVAAVVGGIGNVRGAAAGALLIAFVEVFVHHYVMAAFPDKSWLGQLQDIYVFGILILVLMFKPSGLLGTSAVEKV